MCLERKTGEAYSVEAINLGGVQRPLRHSAESWSQPPAVLASNVARQDGKHGDAALGSVCLDIRAELELNRGEGRDLGGLVDTGAAGCRGEDADDGSKDEKKLHS